MQISTRMLAALAFLALLSAPVANAVDSPAQAKARAALEQQLEAMKATNAPIAAAPEKPRKVTPAPAPAIPLRPVTPPPGDTVRMPAPIPGPGSSVPAKPTDVRRPAPVDEAAIAKARDAVRSKISELNAQTPPPSPTPVEEPKPAKVAKVKPEKPSKPAKAPKSAPEVANVPPPEKAPMTKPAPPPKKKPEMAKKAPVVPPKAASESNPPLVANEAPAPMIKHKRGEFSEENEAPNSARTEVAVNQSPKPRKEPKKPSAKHAPQEFSPIAGPASSLSADKDHQLAELLRKYQADELTPQQYHAERAKILAQP